MNGNIKRVDDAVNKFSKRREFMMIQNNIADALESDCYAFTCYAAICRRGGSDFNLTVDSISNVLQCSTKTANKALQKLKDMGLLEEKLDRDITGEAFTETQDGRRVPNNRRVYIIHSALKIGAEPPQMLTPRAFIAADFSADEINEAAQETVPEVMQEPPQVTEPPQVVQEMPPREDTPPLTPTPTQKPIYKNADIQALIERREQHIYNIAADEGVFTKAGKEKLLKWIKRFKSEVKKPAADTDIKYMANLISGNSEYLLPDYIRRKALAEAAV